MQLTAKDLYNLGGVIITLANQEVELDMTDTFTVFDSQFNEVEKEVVIFRGNQENWFCAYDKLITLDEQGKGTISLTEGDEWDIFDEVTLPIEVKVIVPLTAEILLKKRIGIL